MKDELHAKDLQIQKAEADKLHAKELRIQKAMAYTRGFSDGLIEKEGVKKDNKMARKAMKA